MTKIVVLIAVIMFIGVGCKTTIPEQTDEICRLKKDSAGMTLVYAKVLAHRGECSELLGWLKRDSVCNSNTGTWWIDIEPAMGKEKSGCNPACVVNVITEEVEINWRCTGLLPPE